MKNPSDKYTCFFDGCCEPVNPGGTASFGAVILKNGVEVWRASEIFYPEKGKEKHTSNNVAEYSAFLAILDWFASQKLKDAHIEVYGDSMLVICQMFGTWRIKKGFYVPLAQKAKVMVADFTDITGEWIPREENSLADELSKAELKKAGVKFMIQP